MGQSVSLYLVRAAGLVMAGLLLLATIAPGHAANYDDYGLKPTAGDSAADYGIKPLPDAVPGATPAPGTPAASNNSYNAAPVSGGYNPPAGYGYQPAPGPVASGYVPAASGQPGAPQAYQQPYQPPPQQVPYGYRPGDGVPVTQPVLPAYPARPQMASGYYPGAAQQYPAYAANPGARANPDYVLGPGDRVKLTVFGEPDLSGDYSIDGMGSLSMPLIGQVRAAGYTATQLEQTIGGALAQGYLKSPRVSVEVSTYRPFYIIGAVNRPGQYPYVDHMNALNAIALAGGFTPTAVESVVFVRREGSNEEVEVPVDRSTMIQPGDVIKVHNTLFSDFTNWLAPLSGVAGSAATAAILQ